jgi:CRISPR/Cas system-associated exonuclease Cas4 (RecB family)
VESSAPRLAETGPELVEALEYNAPELSNVTVTALARYADCPRKYYLGSYLGFEGGRPEPEDPDSPPRLSAGDFGIQVHAVLAGTTPPDADPEAIQLAETFRRSTLGKRVERASRVEREFDFLMAVEDVVVSGQVDLWFEEGGELVIVDYKTDSVAAAEARQRAHDYELQLRMYAMAVERVAGRAVDRAFLVFLRPNTSIEISLAPSLLESPEGVIAELQNSLAGSRFPLREGEHCRRCQFFHDLCPAAYADRPKARSAPRAAVKAQSDIR